MWTISWVERTGSTNADLTAAARDGAAEGLVLATGHQDAGRGRLDRTWEAPAGTSLAASFLLRPDRVPLARWPWLPLLAGVAFVDAVRQAAGVDATLKWPNDILVDGRKLAGILVERVEQAGQDERAEQFEPAERVERVEQVERAAAEQAGQDEQAGQAGAAAIVGIGLNLSQTAEQLLPGAVSLALALREAGRPDAAPDTGALLEALADRLADRYIPWHTAAGDPAAGVAEAYVFRCDTLGREIRAELPGGGVLRGRATGIDDSGRLVVDAPGGPVAISAGDIVHIRPV